MIKKVFSLVLTSCLGMMFLSGCGEQEKKADDNVYQFTESNLPAGKDHQVQAGLANPFAGQLKFNGKNVLVIAGGANFSSQETATQEDLMSGKSAPNLDSKKVFHTDIFVGNRVKSNDDDENVSYTFALNELQVPEIAYGASVVVGNKLFCIGGQSSKGNLDSVFYITTEKAATIEGDLTDFLAINDTIDFSVDPKFKQPDDKITVKLPKLPTPVSKIKAIAVGNTIYVAGGNMDYILKLNLKPAVDKEGNAELKWETMPTPFGKIAQPVLAVQGDKMYILGGMESIDGVPQALTKNYVYNMKNDKKTQKLLKKQADKDKKEVELGSLEKSGDKYFWSASKTEKDGKPVFTGKYIWRDVEACLDDEDKPVSFGGAYGIAVGPQNIVAVGGVNTEIFNTYLTEYFKVKGNETAEKAIMAKYFYQAPAAYKFNKAIYNLNTVTNQWIKLQDYPYTGPAGAPVVKLSGSGFEIAVINGEIKPGVRTNRVAIGSFVRNPTFGMFNYIILIGYMIGMLCLGFYFMKREGGTEDFFKGGGRIPWWAAGISIYATMLSSITFMALPASVFMKSWAPFMSAIMIFATAPIIVKYYLPFFRRLNVTTAYEYLEVRFSAPIRVLSSLLFMVFKIARLGIVSYLPAVALTSVTGLDINVCIIVVAVITMIYCSMGGVEAVIWGDVIQGIVLVGGALIVVAIIAFSVDGGIGGIIELGQAENKFEIFNFALDWTEPTFWVIVIGGLGINLSSYSGDQSVVQRYLTTKDEKSAANSIIFNGVASVVGSVIFYFIGTAMFSFYTQSPESLAIVGDKNEILPYFVIQNLPSGLAGLLIAALFSATMSTLSSDLNSAATAYTSDIHLKIKPNASDHQCLNVARIATVLFGIFGTIFALALAHMEIDDLFTLFNAVVGLLASSLGGLFLLGIFTKRVGKIGAFAGFFTSITVLLLIKFAKIFEVSGWLYGTIGLVISLVVALAVSLVFPNKKNIDGLTIYTLNK